jgi:FMN-dependent NADH-azoreductase
MTSVSRTKRKFHDIAYDIPPSRFDYQATYLNIWLQLIGVRDLRSVIVDNAWNRDRQESEASLAKGKAALEQLVEWFLL